MKLKSLLFIVVVSALVSSCGPQVYKSNEFADLTATHKEVAILPASVKIELRPNDMKKITPEQLKENERSTGSTIQDKMYSWFLRRSGKYKYTVNFQDVSRTNALLAQAGITPENIATKTKEEICKLLNVDAIISSSASMKKPMSDGAALAVGVLLGGWGSTNDVQTSININEGKSGKLVWKYDWVASGSVGSNTDKLVDNLMRNASKRFPYNAK